MAAGKVFIDTSGFIAIARRDDENHEAARAIIDALRRSRARLYTTNFVLAETYSLYLRYLGGPAARAFLRQVDSERPSAVIRIEEGDEAEARSIIYRYADKDFSLVDAASFAVMKRLAIPAAFTFDRHFRQFGLDVLAA